MKNENFKLSEQKCEACSPETRRLKGEELYRYCDRLQDGWELIEEHHLKKTYAFNNFREALDFTVKLGEMSEKESHHPEIRLSWGKMTVTIYTHVIDGLSRNDFIWAAKADELFS